MNASECIKQLMQQKIVIAVGCTEPVAVALCVAKAKETLKESVSEVELYLSKNIIKNAMGVGIPGTGMIGLPIAIALGVVCGESAKGLEVLCQAKDNVQKAERWLATHKVKISPKDTEEKLYIECHCKADKNTSTAIISGQHTNFVLVKYNDDVLFEKQKEIEECLCNQEDILSTLNCKMVWDYATTEPIENLQWINDTVRLNAACSEASLKGSYGLQVGKTLLSCWDKSYRNEIIARSCAASDARMDGITLPIYSNSGSGNQGITCTLPVYYYALKKNAEKDALTRALTLSHLMSIYIKSKIGCLSAMCGAVNASMGAASGISYLSGGGFEQVCFTLRNMINTITGIVCDGAKPSCALKIATALNSAFDSILLAQKNIVVAQTDGIAEKDIDRSIEDIGRIGRYGMNQTDDMILDIMTHKKN